MNRWEKYKRILGFFVAAAFWCITFPQLAFPKDSIRAICDGEEIELDEEELLEQVLNAKPSQIKIRSQLYEFIIELFEKDEKNVSG